MMMLSNIIRDNKNNKSEVHIMTMSILTIASFSAYKIKIYDIRLLMKWMIDAEKILPVSSTIQASITPAKKVDKKYISSPCIAVNNTSHTNTENVTPFSFKNDMAAPRKKNSSARDGISARVSIVTILSPDENP